MFLDASMHGTNQDSQGHADMEKDFAAVMVNLKEMERRDESGIQPRGMDGAGPRSDCTYEDTPKNLEDMCRQRAKQLRDAARQERHQPSKACRLEEAAEELEQEAATWSLLPLDALAPARLLEIFGSGGGVDGTFARGELLVAYCGSEIDRGSHDRGMPATDMTLPQRLRAAARNYETDKGTFYCGRVVSWLEELAAADLEELEEQHRGSIGHGFSESAGVWRETKNELERAYETSAHSEQLSACWVLFRSWLEKRVAAVLPAHADFLPAPLENLLWPDTPEPRLAERSEEIFRRLSGEEVAASVQKSNLQYQRTVKSLDPDAVTRQRGSRLHSSNAVSDEKILSAVWRYIRAGRMPRARRQCWDVGQSWRAASLGWSTGFGPVQVGPKSGIAAEEDEEPFEYVATEGTDGSMVLDDPMEEVGVKFTQAEYVKEALVAEAEGVQESAEESSRGLAAWGMWKWSCMHVAEAAAQAGSPFEGAVYGLMCGSKLALSSSTCPDWEVCYSLHPPFSYPLSCVPLALEHEDRRIEGEFESAAPSSI
eukprot:gene8758-10379_t